MVRSLACLYGITRMTGIGLKCSTLMSIYNTSPGEGIIDHRRDTSSVRDRCFDQIEESLYDRACFDRCAGPCRRTGHPEREPTRTMCVETKRSCPLLPTALAFVSYGFGLVQVAQVPRSWQRQSTWQSTVRSKYEIQ